MAANVYDVLLDADLDLRIERGDFVRGESTLQHQALLLLTNKGEWRQAPTVGVGLNTYLLDEASDGEMKQVIRREYERDGMQVGTISLTAGLPLIEASYA